LLPPPSLSLSRLSPSLFFFKGGCLQRFLPSADGGSPLPTSVCVLSRVPAYLAFRDVLVKLYVLTGGTSFLASSSATSLHQLQQSTVTVNSNVSKNLTNTADPTQSFVDIMMKDGKVRTAVDSNGRSLSIVSVPSSSKSSGKYRVHLNSSNPSKMTPRSSKEFSVNLDGEEEVKWEQLLLRVVFSARTPIDAAKQSLAQMKLSEGKLKEVPLQNGIEGGFPSSSSLEGSMVVLHVSEIAPNCAASWLGLEVSSEKYGLMEMMSTCVMHL
jgi:hypothetical protein